MSIPPGGGGSATQAGTDYQNRVAALMAVRILADQESSPPWNLPARLTFEFLRCETEQPVDDIFIGFSEGFAFIQAKHTLTLQTATDSDIASVLDQFVRQFLTNKNIHGTRPWERPLDAKIDRLVLVTSSRCSAPIKTSLAAILNRVRSLVSGQALNNAATNQLENRVLNVILGHIKRSFHNATGVNPTDDEVRQILMLIWVSILDVDAGEPSEHEAKNLLRSAILKDPTQVDLAWDRLLSACAGFAASKSGTDRSALHTLLSNAGVILEIPQSFRDDINRLLSFSRLTMNLLSDLSKITVGSTHLKINRKSSISLREAVEIDSLLIVGEPGAGKSAALHDLVETLFEEGLDVIFMAVDRLDARSIPLLQRELGLTRDFLDLLKNWPGKDPGFLIVDALDAARSQESAQTIRDLIKMTMKLGGRWRVVASVRKFDLRHSPELQRFFIGQASSEFTDAEFQGIRHLNIPLLDDEEFGQIPAQSRDLANLLSRVDDELRNILRNPYNLRLIGELVGQGVTIESLTPIRTQIGLLERYWEERVVREDGKGDAREAVLREIVTLMVENRSLRINRSEIATDPATSPHLRYLLSCQVLNEWQPFAESRPEAGILTLAHHVLFDYAVERLMLRVTQESFVEKLESDPDLVIAIRPSLVLHFHYLWGREPSHVTFWNLIFQMNRSEAIPEVGKLIGPGVAAVLVTELSDCEKLFSELMEA